MRMLFVECDESLTKDAYVKEIMAADLDKLANFIKICGFLMQTASLTHNIAKHRQLPEPILHLLMDRPPQNGRKADAVNRGNLQMRIQV